MVFLILASDFSWEQPGIYALGSEAIIMFAYSLPATVTYPKPSSGPASCDRAEEKTSNAQNRTLTHFVWHQASSPHKKHGGWKPKNLSPF